jgi:hypothetical protein
MTIRQNQRKKEKRKIVLQCWHDTRILSFTEFPIVFLKALKKSYELGPYQIVFTAEARRAQRCFFLFFAVKRTAKNKRVICLKIIKPLRSLRLCGESIHLVENPDTYLTAQFEKFQTIYV